MNAARRRTAKTLIVIAALLGEPEELLGQPASQRQTVQAGPATLLRATREKGWDVAHARCAAPVRVVHAPISSTAC